ncbi:hypothetical protein FACS1894184_16140 [Clostridia bacterium]|nr:hypothetical protein FACS1894184_16140 [Clostridia bacterium]
MTFGQLIRNYRKDSGYTIREAAAALELAQSYLTDIENGKRSAPNAHFVKIIELYGIDDVDQFYDLAGLTHHNSFVDINEYLGANPIVREVIRLARDNGLGEERWRAIMELMEEN